MNLNEILEPIAAQFRAFNLPEPITHWGHPVMMGIVILAMGSAAGYTGWKGRLSEDKEVAAKNRTDHRKIAPLMALFLTMGYTGGILSLVMQNKPTLESPHFWTGSAIVALLATNGILAAGGFWGDKSSLRMLHAYFGTFLLGLFLIHAALGLKLGLSI